MNEFPVPDPAAAEHGARVAAFVAEAIDAAGGSIGFAEYMDAVLYAPGLGYYSAGSRKFGGAGDFITAPEVSPLFARCFARQFAETMQDADVLEVGAGTGRFAATALGELAALDALPRRYLVLEVAADLRARQRETLEALSPALLDRVEWLDRLPAGFEGIVFANEVLDALPVERFRRSADGIEQLRVTRAGGRFAARYAPAPPDLAEAVAAIERDVGRLPDGYESEVCLRLAPWITAVADAVARGVLLFVDYGMSRAEYYAADRTRGTLMCHYRHRAHDDPFVWPGLQDITAHVDFTAVAEAGVAAGLEFAGYTTQAHYLLASGLDRMIAEPVADERAVWLRAQQVRMLTLPGEMGERFKVMGFTKGGAPAPSGFALRDLRDRL